MTNLENGHFIYPDESNESYGSTFDEGSNFTIKEVKTHGSKILYSPSGHKSKFSYFQKHKKSTVTLPKGRSTVKFPNISKFTRKMQKSVSSMSRSKISKNHAKMNHYRSFNKPDYSQVLTNNSIPGTGLFATRPKNPHHPNAQNFPNISQNSNPIYFYYQCSHGIHDPCSWLR